MTAIGTWTRGGNRDMTQTVTWSADVQGILDVGQHVLMTATGYWQATVTAKYVDRGNAVFGRAPVSVTCYARKAGHSILASAQDSNVDALHLGSHLRVLGHRGIIRGVRLDVAGKVRKRVYRVSCICHARSFPYYRA